jgi:hypothetical protein
MSFVIGETKIVCFVGDIAYACDISPGMTVEFTYTLNQNAVEPHTLPPMFAETFGIPPSTYVREVKLSNMPLDILDLSTQLSLVDTVHKMFPLTIVYKYENY